MQYNIRSLCLLTIIYKYVYFYCYEIDMLTVTFTGFSCRRISMPSDEGGSDVVRKRHHGDIAVTLTLNVRDLRIWLLTIAVRFCRDFEFSSDRKAIRVSIEHC